MKNLVTIIVPVYQIEKYIGECIESIIKQTYPYWELILVNDGSTDNSAFICEEYAKKDKRIKVYHQQNWGVSIARNKGLQMASGKYAMFVDGDDYLEEKTLSIIVNLAVTYNLSILQFGIQSFKDQSVLITKKEDQSNFNIYTDLQNYHTFQYGVWGYLLHNTIYTRIRFSQGVRYAEDIEYITKCISQSPRLGVISKTFYYQRLHQQSAMAKLNSYEKVVDHLIVIRNLSRYAHGRKQHICNFINLQIIRLVKSYISFFIKNPIKNENINHIKKDFRSIYPFINSKSLYEKVIFIMAYIDIRIYIILLKLYAKKQKI